MYVLGVRRMVVGHQPHGDAPYILSRHGVTCICADNAYSRNTQWPKRYLDMVYGIRDGDGHAQTHTHMQRHDDSSAGDVYMSVAEYEKQKESGDPNSQTHADTHTHTQGKLHSTRSDVAYTEVLLTFPDTTGDLIGKLMRASSC
ncbi:hypothetical protein EON63_11375 [archaeon]|nr:MAG: hypothetical protein EON63_11375 [archaeon]